MNFYPHWSNNVICTLEIANCKLLETLYDTGKRIIFPKELSHCHKLKFSNHYIIATHLRRPSIFHNLNSVTINNLSFKFQNFKPTGCEDIGI